MSRYIDADLLKDKTTRVNNIWNVTTNAEGKGLDEIIDDIPTADVRENVRGEWLYKPVSETTICSACGKVIFNHLEEGCVDASVYKFCPNCGAQMVDRSC